MPLQNKVDPWGRLHAVPERGAFLGNRGKIHNEQRQIVAPWRGLAWITCRTEYQGIKRPIFAQNSYSELFFLDEATAFSAGHRPCGDCRKQRFKDFKAAWISSNRDLVQSDNPTIAEIDKIIHGERISENGSKRKYRVSIGQLPSGVFVEYEGIAYLVWGGKLWPWSFDGYGQARKNLLPSTEVDVLTPASIVKLFASGFTPQLHLSAFN